MSAEPPGLRKAIDDGLAELAIELEGLYDCQTWNAQFRFAQRMRAIMLQQGVPWDQQAPTGYSTSIRKAADRAGLEARDMLLGVNAIWDKVLLPEDMKAPEFAYLEAMLRHPRAKVFADDFPGDDVRTDAELVVTIVEILDKWGEKARKEPYLPVRALGKLLKTGKNYAQNLLRQLEELGYIRRERGKGSTRKSPPISLGRRYYEAQASRPDKPTERYADTPRDKGSEGSDPKESYDPEVPKRSKGPKGVGNSPNGAPIQKIRIPEYVDPSALEALAPEDREAVEKIEANKRAYHAKEAMLNLNQRNEIGTNGDSSVPT